MTIRHSERLEWDRAGRCKYRVSKTKKCTGVPGYGGGCQGSYSDEYGSIQSCSQCNGRGEINYWVYICVPEFDAPKPKTNWIPDWIET